MDLDDLGKDGHISVGCLGVLQVRLSLPLGFGIYSCTTRQVRISLLELSHEAK